MDLMLKKMLRNNACRVKSVTSNSFPTQYIFTRNIELIGEDMEFEDQGFISGYDMLRRRQVYINESDEVSELTVYNPKDISALLLQDHKEDINTIKEGIKKWKKINILPMCSRGDPMKLSFNAKKVLVDLYLVTGSFEVEEGLVNRRLEEILYGLAGARLMSELRYGFFFSMDFEWKSDEEALEFAASKWIALVNVYKELYSQDSRVSEEWRDSVENIIHPDLSNFKNYESIIDYWPYALAPRPDELLKSEQMYSTYESWAK